MGELETCTDQFPKQGAAGARRGTCPRAALIGTQPDPRAVNDRSGNASFAFVDCRGVRAGRRGLRLDRGTTDLRGVLLGRNDLVLGERDDHATGAPVGSVNGGSSIGRSGP